MNRIIMTLLLALATLSAAAQSKKDSTIWVNGTVADGFTKAAIPDVLVTLLRQDSTMIDTTRVYKSRGYTWGIGSLPETTGYGVRVKREPAQYILKFEHPNYETTYANVEMKSVSRRRQYIEGPKVYMKKTVRAHHFEGGELGEVVIKATKVKMVWRGDTLVYNADAFNVPEGSMLDGLIKQLPGVELKENGEIFVNGKKIDNLTLNGADFFKGKNKIMLQNLPYFTVKNVEVYNKQTPLNKYLGITDEDKKEYTMDVVLKREYSIGGSANVEAGYGTEDRYKLKVFGMRYSDHTRAVLFGGANNINETASYEAEGQQYTDKTHQAGNRHFRQAGGMFTYMGSENRLSNATEVNVEWQDDATDTRTQNENYLTDGTTTYGRSESHSRNRPVNFGLRNTFTLNEPIYVMSRVNLDYQRYRYDSEGWNVSTADAMMTDSINSSWYRSRNRSAVFSGWGYADVAYRLPTGDQLSLSLNGSFSREADPETESQNRYIYHKLGTTDDRDRLTRSPYYSYSLPVKLTYRFDLKGWSLSPYYRLHLQRNHNERNELLRDEIDYVLDMENSYDTDTRNIGHVAGMSINYYHQTKKKSYLSIYADLSTNFDTKRMTYDTESLTRHYTTFGPYVYFYYSTNEGRKRLQANYQIGYSTPSVTDLISRPQTSNPLSIYLSNPDLQQQARHSYSITYIVRRDSIDQTLRFDLSGNATHNAIAHGYSYDPVTGVRTYRPENIGSGNWGTTLTTTWNRAIDKKKLWNIGNELRLSYNYSTSFASVLSAETEGQPPLSHVGNVLVGYKPSIRFQKNALTLQLKGDVAYRNIHRNITVGQQPTDLWDFSYGLYAQYRLPWKLTVDTDISMNSHRGYGDPEMNDNRLYWDASLTKSFKEGRWVVKLRGYDLLKQVSNLRYNINAQGRTETWSNTLRRYAMMTVSYRFTQKPKKQK